MTENSISLNDTNISFNKTENNIQFAEYSVDAMTVNSSDSDNLTDEEIDRQIADSMDRADKLTGIWEQYKPSSNYYRRISDELEGKKITANGLKYPYEITEKDLFFPLTEEQPDSQYSGDIVHSGTDL